MNVRTNELPDELDERLRLAAIRPGADAGYVRGSLRDLVDMRVTAARSHNRKRRIIVPTAVAGGVLALLGTGAAVANQWAPWAPEADHPDMVFTRDWYDVSGNFLGYCEGRIEAVHSDPQKVAAARAYFASVDVDMLEPNMLWLASALASQGELDRIGELIEGAEPTDVGDLGNIAPQEKVPDADLLQNALMRTVLDGMHAAMHDPQLSATGDVQCSTDSPDAQ
jgi:hypothetical protein